MLSFRSEAEVGAWCERRGIARGAVLTLHQMWELSVVWYAGRTDPTWRGRSPEEAEALFRSVGLEGAFWTF